MSIEPLPNDKLAKLPRWAQDHIRVLEMRLNERDATIALLHGESKSSVFIRGYGEADRPLGDNATVVFAIGENEYIEATMSRDMKGRVQIRGSCFGLSRLTINPHASNVINVGMSR